MAEMARNGRNVPETYLTNEKVQKNVKTYNFDYEGDGPVCCHNRISIGLLLKLTEHMYMGNTVTERVWYVIFI